MSVLSKVLSLDKLSCPQIWNIEQEKDREKEKVGSRPAKLNKKKGDKDVEREIKNKGDIFFVGRTTWKFCSSGDKMRNDSSNQGENERQWKKVNGDTYDISPIKRVTKKFLEVSRCIRSRAKQRQRTVQEKCAACEKLLLLIRPSGVFHLFPASHAFAA